MARELFGQDGRGRGGGRRAGVGLAAGAVLQAVGVGPQIQVPVRVDLRAEGRLDQRVDSGDEESAFRQSERIVIIDRPACRGRGAGWRAP